MITPLPKHRKKQKFKSVSLPISYLKPISLTYQRYRFSKTQSLPD